MTTAEDNVSNESVQVIVLDVSSYTPPFNSDLSSSISYGSISSILTNTVPI